jgi:hypothetical protein
MYVACKKDIARHNSSVQVPPNSADPVERPPLLAQFQPPTSAVHSYFLPHTQLPAAALPHTVLLLTLLITLANRISLFPVYISLFLYTSLFFHQGGVCHHAQV